MNLITNTFNNREISIFLWVFIFCVWALSGEKLRISFINVLKVFFQKKILLAIFFMILYSSFIVFLYYRAGFWNKSLVKDTIYWFFGIAFIMLMNINKASEKEHFFKSIILDNVKLILILEFIINLYVFNIFIELILIPVLFFIAGMSAIAENKEKYNPVKKLLDYILMILGVWILIHATYNIINNYRSFINKENLFGFCLTPLLTLSYLPFIYFMALYMQYEVFFVRMGFLNTNKSYINYAKWRIIIFCNFNLRKLNRFSKGIDALQIGNISDINLIIQNFKNK